jgi:hypothetical protein
MGLGSALGTIGRAFGGRTSYRTPPFLPPGEYDPESEEAGGGEPADAPPVVPPSAASAMGGKSVPTYRPELDPDTQKYLDAVRQPPPQHPQHGKLRSIGEALTTGFIGQDLSEKIWDSKHAREKAAYERNVSAAVLPAKVRAQAEKGAADVSHTMASGALAGKQAENYDANAVTNAVERGGELEPDNRVQPPAGQPPREGSSLTVGGKQVFFPSRTQRVKEETAAKNEAAQATYRPLPAEVTKSLGLPADFKVPPGEVDSYVRIYESKVKDRGLKFESHVDENTGDVTTIGRDPVSGKETFRDVLKGVARKRPQVNSFVNSGEGQEMLERVAQSLANGDMSRLRDIASLRGDQRVRIYDRAMQINPKFSTAEIDRKIKMEDYYANGKGATNLQSFGTFLEHGGSASDAVNGIRQSNTPIINQPINWLRKNVSGDANFQAFITALEPVRKEFESFLLGGRALYGDDRKNAEIILNENSSPAQIQSALKAMGHTAQARFNEENFRYKKVMGRDLADPFSPEAMDGAQKMGLKLGGGHQQPASGQQTTPTVRTKAEFDALPKGAKYIDSEDGKTYIKP